MTGRVLIYVQHLLGVGHLQRAAAMARALASRRLEVWVILGGSKVEGIDFDGCACVFLPPVRAVDASFKVLIGEDGAPMDDNLREARVSRLLTELETIRPDVLLIEQFPFGRRAFRFELMPLLARARATDRRPAVVSSVRDVLVARPDREKRREMIRLARAWFDRVLVHGDPDLLPLEASFPEADEIRDLIRYTGYVTKSLPTPSAGAPAAQSRSRADRSEAGKGEVIVSVGGGAVGEGLLRLALAARPLTRLRDRPWRLICGPNLPEALVTALSWPPPAGVIIERWRPDLPAILRNCVLSISQAGYNTVMDILQAKARAVVVPFADGDQTEQALRARVLADRGALHMVEPAMATPEVLARTVDAAAEATPAAVAINVEGAATTAQEIAALCGGHGAGAGT